MADTAIGIFLENLERLISCSTLDLIMPWKEKLQSLHDELVLLRDFLENSAEKQDHHPKVKNLVMRIRDLAHKAEVIVNRFTVESFMDKERIWACKFDRLLDHHPKVKNLVMPIRYLAHKAETIVDRFTAKSFVCTACKFDHQLGRVRKEIGSIKIELKRIYVKRMHEVEIPKDVAGSSSGGSSRQVNIAKLKGKILVGFDDEATRIMEELVDWQQRHLSIISIVGAGGAGKTTLASKVYHDRLIQERFPIRGWIVVSQVYDKKDLLISILKSTSLINDGDCDLSGDQLGEQLFRRLRDKKYLVVIDDIWSVKAWNDIQMSFPNDGTRGSRVLFTTRHSVVGEIAQHHHDLLPLSPGDSWDLLQRHVFGEEIRCPSELVQTGMEVAEKCGGLPLAIVVIAGILKETLALPWWEQVAGSLSSIIAENDEIKTDVEAHGDFIRSLIKDVKNSAFTDIEDVVTFVKWLDDELSRLVDEIAVLKHFDWPEQKADALREAAFGYRDLKKIESGAASFHDNLRQPCTLALKKMQALFEKLEQGVHNLSLMRDSATKRYSVFLIPTYWMLDTGFVSQIKLASVKLAMQHMKRVSAELEIVGGCSEDGLVIQGVRFSFRVHQFAGGFDVETMKAFQELRDQVRACHVLCQTSKSDVRRSAAC